MGVLILLALFFGFIALYSRYSEDSGTGSSGGGYYTSARNSRSDYGYDARDHERRPDDDYPEDEDYYYGGSRFDDRSNGYDYDDDPDNYDRDVDDFDDDDGDFD